MDEAHRNRVIFASAVTLAIRTILALKPRRSIIRSEIHPGGPSYARQLAEAIYKGSDKQFEELFRLKKVIFDRLVRWLKKHANLRPSKYQTVEQKVMVFLWILAHNESQRNTAHKFQISQSTVSEIFEQLLPMFESLHKAFVRLPKDNWLDPTYELDPKLNAFNGCIGAIDGTHIAAHIPSKRQIRWRDRKGHLTQNVFAAVRSDYSFSYVLAGAEGSINDATICTQAFSRSFRVPPNRYYVVDAGFGTRRGIIVPFPGVRYHLQDWRDAKNPPENSKELYNLRHASIRVVVEQAFGHLKRRWKIVRIAAPEYSISKQVQIVYAVTGLHNFIIAHEKSPVKLTHRETEVMVQAQGRAERVVGTRHPDYIRHTAAVLMWRQYGRYRQR